MSRSVAQSGQTGYRGNASSGEEELLPCGCAPHGSKSRKRCDVALALRAEVNDLQEEVYAAPAGPQRMAVMGRKAEVYSRYRDHLSRRKLVLS